MSWIEIKCRKCTFRSKTWKAMLQHLKTAHNVSPKNMSQAVRQKLAGYYYKKGKSNKKAQPKRRKQVSENNAYTIQEILIPVMLKIPLAIGNVTIIQRKEEP